MKNAVLLVALIVLGLSACTTSHVVTGQIRPPTEPDQVKIYSHPPAKYAEIALIQSDSTGGSPFSGQARLNTVIRRMKKDAAKLGANGILITGLGEVAVTSTGIVTANSYGPTTTGIVTTRAGFNKTGSCVAIWVTEE